jgi:hypothetical protein
MANERHKTRPDEATLAEVTKEMNEPRMAASVRKALGTAAAVNRPFRSDDCVYNRETKEHGLVKQVYAREGVTMYKVWLPAMPDLLRWGHFVSDWAEGVLEPSDKMLVQSACLPNGL